MSLRFLAAISLSSLSCISCLDQSSTNSNLPSKYNVSTELYMDISSERVSAHCSLSTVPADIPIAKEAPTKGELESAEEFLLCERIEGLEIKPGINYRVQVIRHELRNPPTDMSPYQYELVRIIHEESE